MFDDKKNALAHGLAGHGRMAGFIGLFSLLSGGWAGAQQPSTGAQESQAEALESIVVTARRREESLQDTPVAVTALSAAALERQQATGTMDLDKIAPNIQFHSYGTLTGNNSAAQVFIRGIGQTDATPAVDPGVGIYIDDVYMGRAVGGAMDFRDIANVQIRVVEAGASQQCAAFLDGVGRQIEADRFGLRRNRSEGQHVDPVAAADLEQ